MSVRNLINPKLQDGKLIYLENDSDTIVVVLTERMINKYEESLLKKEETSKPA